MKIGSLFSSLSDENLASGLLELLLRLRLLLRLLLLLLFFFLFLSLMALIYFFISLLAASSISPLPIISYIVLYFTFVYYFFCSYFIYFVYFYYFLTFVSVVASLFFYININSISFIFWMLLINNFKKFHSNFFFASFAETVGQDRSLMKSFSKELTSSKYL